jgi:hypothetical protein
MGRMWAGKSEEESLFLYSSSGYMYIHMHEYIERYTCFTSRYQVDGRYRSAQLLYTTQQHT